mgnify:CR=1 FL=1
METMHSHAASLEDALDFVNTRELDRDGYTDHLPDMAAALEWLEGRGLLHEVARQRLLWAYEADRESQSNVLRRVLRLREALRFVHQRGRFLAALVRAGALGPVSEDRDR